MENSNLQSSNGATPQQNANASSFLMSPKSISFLRDTRPWISFLGIVGFVMCGLLFLLSIFLMYFISSNPFFRGELLGNTVGLLIGSIVGFFPALFMYNYARNLKRFLATSDSQAMDEALENQKKYFIFIGVVMIIYLAIIAIALLVAMGAILSQL